MNIDLDRVLRSLPSVLWTAQPNGEVDFASEHWCACTGQREQDALCFGWQGAIDATDLAPLQELFQGLLGSGVGAEMNVRLRSKVRPSPVLAFSFKPILDDAGQVVKWCAFGGIGEGRLDGRAEPSATVSALAYAIPVPVVLTTPSRNVEEVNFLARQFFGDAVERSSLWNIISVVHGDDLDHTISVQNAAYRDGVAYSTESRFRYRDGTYRWCNVLGLPVDGMDGDVSLWIHLFIDIDHRKRAQGASRHSEQGGCLVADCIPGGIEVLGPDGKLESVNRHVAEYFGKPAEELKQIGLTPFIHQEDLPVVLQASKASTTTGAPFDEKFRLLHHSGIYRWFHVRGSPLRDENGKIVRWYALHMDIEDQKRAESALAGGEFSFKLAIDTIPALAWSSRADGSAEYLSQYYLNFVGASEACAVGWGWASAVHPADRTGLMETWQSILRSGEAGEAEARMRRFDGEYRWILFRVNPLRDSEGKIARWYGVNIEIHDRKRAEENLAKEKHLLEKIALGCPVQEVLAALCKFVEENTSNCYCDIHPIEWSIPAIEYSVAPSLPAEYTDPIAGLSISGDALPCAIAAREKVQVIAEDMNSDIRWLGTPVRLHVLKHGLRSVWSTPIYAKDGQVLGTLCLYQRQPASPTSQHQDLIAHATHLASIAIERSRTEAALRRSETILSEAQQLSSTGSFSWLVNTDRLVFSRELCRIFEIDFNEVVTLAKVRERVHPDDLPLLLAQMARVRAGQGYIGYEIRLKMPDGRIKHLRTFGRVITQQDGQIECLTAVQETTQLRAADEALSKARAELAHVSRVSSLATLTASIAHEVNQPLSGIITNATTCLRFLAADPPDVESARETARRTIRDGNRAADVIARLRALFSNRDPAIEAVDLNAAVREVLALLRAEIQRSGTMLHTALDHEILLVRGDRIQLQQVIMNLVRNALEAMIGVDRARKLTIKTERATDNQVRLSVEDSGSGFGPDGGEGIFNPFYTTKIDGMGIGLSVCRSIIEKHSGRLWVTENPEYGVTFSFTVPSCSQDQIGKL